MFLYKTLLGLTVACMAACSLAGSNTVKEKIAAQDTEVEFQRTTSCVMGALPVELQYVMDDNPPKIHGEHLEEVDIDKLVESIDGRIRRLLTEAVTNVWERVQGREDYEVGFARVLETELLFELSEIAPSYLQLQFCGDANSIGNAVLSALHNYFSRAYVKEDGSIPRWVHSLGEHNAESAAGLLTVATASKAAGLPITLDELVESYRDPG